MKVSRSGTIAGLLVVGAFALSACGSDRLMSMGIAVNILRALPIYGV